MKDIKLRALKEALKELYIEQVEKLEKMEEYKAEKEKLLCEIAQELCEKQQEKIKKDREPEFTKANINEKMKEICDSFQRRFIETNKVKFDESIIYKLQKGFISEIESELRSKRLIAGKDAQGNIFFKKGGGNAGVW